MHRLKNEKYIEIFLYFYGKGERKKIIKNGWDFFQDQILGMHWLKDLIGKLLVKAGLGEGRFPGEFLHFFLYDIIKIFVLLAVLIFVISYIQSYFPPEKSRNEKVTPSGNPALVNPIKIGIDEQEQNGVTVPRSAPIRFAQIP